MANLRNIDHDLTSSVEMQLRIGESSLKMAVTGGWWIIITCPNSIFKWRFTMEICWKHVTFWYILWEASRIWPRKTWYNPLPRTIKRWNTIQNSWNNCDIVCLGDVEGSWSCFSIFQWVLKSRTGSNTLRRTHPFWIGVGPTRNRPLPLKNLQPPFGMTVKSQQVIEHD